jgi:SNF2 family DNA or RNA helicase
MGLGKTLEAISLLAHLVGDRGVRGPFLVIAPVSVLPNWVRAWWTRTPTLRPGVAWWAVHSEWAHVSGRMAGEVWVAMCGCECDRAAANTPWPPAASLLPLQDSEFKRFAPRLSVLRYEGSKDQRELLQQQVQRLHLRRHGSRWHSHGLAPTPC